jgi:hypothetical protein
MALQKTITVNDGLGQDVAISNAYIRVDSISGGKDNLSILVNLYKDKTLAPIKTNRFLFQPAMDGGNFIAQAYNHLKTLPEFAGATDC